jgi:hypothetical protein
LASINIDHRHTALHTVTPFRTVFRDSRKVSDATRALVIAKPFPDFVSQFVFQWL